MGANSHICSLLGETDLQAVLGSSNCNLTNPFGVITQMWLPLSLYRYIRFFFFFLLLESVGLSTDSKVGE
jgi:hypothetical protein